MKLEQLMQKKQYGDYTTVAKILTKRTGVKITRAYVGELLRRPNAKLHRATVMALRSVIESRERFMF